MPLTLFPAVGPVYVKTVEASRPSCHSVLDDIRRYQQGINRIVIQAKVWRGYHRDDSIRILCRTPVIQVIQLVS